MPVVSAGLPRNYLEHFGWSGASHKDAGFARAVIQTDSGDVWGIMARLCWGLAISRIPACSVPSFCWLCLIVRVVFQQGHGAFWPVNAVILSKALRVQSFLRHYGAGLFSVAASRAGTSGRSASRVSTHLRGKNP